MTSQAEELMKNISQQDALNRAKLLKSKIKTAEYVKKVEEAGGKKLTPKDS